MAVEFRHPQGELLGDFIAPMGTPMLPQWANDHDVVNLPAKTVPINLISSESTPLPSSGASSVQRAFITPMVALMWPRYANFNDAGHLRANKFQWTWLNRSSSCWDTASAKSPSYSPLSLRKGRGTIKVLGVTMGGRKSHVTDICNRVFRGIDPFNRSSKHLKIDRQMSVYRSFIQNTAPCLWRSKYSKTLKIYRNVPFALVDNFASSYEILCERATILPLSSYRLRFLGIGMYKCVNEFNSTYQNDLLTVLSSDYHPR